MASGASAPRAVPLEILFEATTMAKDSHDSAAVRPAPVGALSLDAELAAGAFVALDPIPFGESLVEPQVGHDSLWLIIGGRLALRTVWSPGGGLEVKRTGDVAFAAKTSLGQFDVQLTLEPDDQVLRVVTRFIPGGDLLAPYWPRDLYVLGENGRPVAASGNVEAAQRGVNVGLVYFTLDRPAFGTVMYLQNLTALNDWFRLTGTTPEGVVGGHWPELGYRPASFVDSALPGGRTVVQSDVLLSWNPVVATGEHQEAIQFIELLARLYRRLDDAPKTEFRDWPGRCTATLRHLQRSPKATIEHYGHTYLHPYTDSEYPDCMVQLSVAQSIREYGRWRGEPVPFEAELLAGMRKFYDPELKSLRRYLPNVGDDKNADQVDSWYLYHPLLNLGRLALDGDEGSRSLFFDCLDYAIRAARHFRYEWPVMFDVRTFEVLQKDRKDDGLGQTDVGGLYAYVMLQAFDLSGDDRYRKEAEKALRAMGGWKFELMYQANLSAWGATACIRTWRESGDDWFLNHGQVLLAGFLHNCLIWESEIGTAVHYSNFLGVSCLHDGPYMALYECFESFDAFEELLARGGEALPESIRLLLTEYRRFALHRAWFYFPDALPAEILPPEEEVRNAHIDPKLSFPLEDLYGDGQAPGQVGQEIYGCGAPFTFATRAFHDVPGAPFRLFAEYPVRNLVRDGSRLSFEVDGAKGYGCEARLIPKGRKPLPAVMVGGRARKAGADGGVAFELRAGEPIVVTWEP